MVNSFLVVFSIVVGTWNGNWFPSGRKDLRVAMVSGCRRHDRFDQQQDVIANPLADLPADARGTHPSRRYGDSALDYVFCRGLRTVGLPRIVPNDELSDHYALFVVLK